MATPDMKGAVAAARQFVIDMYPGFAWTDVALEEVEPSDDGSYWAVTVSFPDQNQAPLPAAGIGSLLTKERTRLYKVLKIDQRSNQVLSMKMRM